MSVSDHSRHLASTVVIEQYEHVGYNYRMSDVHAAIGIEQFRRLDHILVRRQHVAQRYDVSFADLACVRVPATSSETPHTYQSYMLTLLPNAPKSRDQVMAELLAEGIQTRRGVMAIHLEPCYRKPDVHLPVTESATRSTLLLPIYATMTEVEQNYVIDHVRRVLAAG